MAILTKSQQLLFFLIKQKGEMEDKTKLARLQYFADFIHYAFNNKTISQDSLVYTREKQGLLSRDFNSDLATLKELGYIKESPKYHFRVVKQYKTDFDNKEIKIIKFVLGKYKDLPYTELVSICHSQIPYLSTTDSGIAEYFTAYNLVDEYPDYASSN